MAAELESSKLDPDSHLMLEQSMLKVPHEIFRRNFKSVQRNVEREKEYLIPKLNEAVNASASGNGTPEQTVASLDEMITRMKAYAKKLETLHEEEARLCHQSQRRINHLQELYGMQTLTDIKYEQWSQTRLNRYIVEYLFRTGFSKTAARLADIKGVTDLVDLGLHENCKRIADGIRQGETKEVLRWCGENRAVLKKQGSGELEFSVRFQEYVELLRQQNFLGARQHALKYLSTIREVRNDKIREAASLMIFPPDTREQPFATMYSQERWNDLANLFIKTHHELFGLSSVPILELAATAGLSVLKTPHCIGAQASSNDLTTEPPSTSTSSTNTVCPVCSTEMNGLARNVPYAHHTKSLVDPDPVILPNGRVYGEKRLSEFNKRNLFRMAAGKIQDPATGEIFDRDQKKKVFIL